MLKPNLFGSSFDSVELDYNHAHYLYNGWKLIKMW